MPQFYFHLRIGRERHSDEIGLELPTVEAAYLEGFAGAQEMWTELLAERSDPTIYSFEISDEAGECLMRVPFTEVLGARKPCAPATHKSTTALMSKTAGLTAALSEQIERTRRMLQETQETLRRSSSQRA